MNTGYTMFLIAVEEMNFTKAANRAFVTQQCLSSHIKKLEEKYNIKLFERTPHLHLTTAGEAFYHSLRQIQIVESAMIKRLAEIKNETRGEIIFGINATRARILLPDLLTEYYQRFPLVKINIILDDMHNLASKLLNGKLDMFLGIDCISNNDFHSSLLGYDDILFIATETILQKFATTPDVLQHTLSSGEINLSHFPNIPFSGNYDGSSFNKLVKRYLNFRNIQQEIIVAISDYELQINLCAQSQLVAFCPKTVLDKVLEQNYKNAKNLPIRIFKLHDMKDSLRIDLVTHKNAYQPYFAKEFMRLLQSHVQKHILKDVPREQE